MANFVYTQCKKAILKGEIDFINDSFKVLVLSSAYTPNQNTDEFVANIPSNAILARSNEITNKVVSNNTFDAADISISDYSGTAFNALAIYKDTGNDNTSNLIFYINTANGLPFAGVNAETDITIQWSNDSGKILSL